MSSLVKLARRPPITVGPDVTVMQAIDVMFDAHVGAVAVVEGKAKLLGIFTERDVLRKIIHEGRNAKSVQVSDVMTTEMIVADDGLSVGDALNLMSEKRIRHLPVLDKDGNIEGMVSLRYLLHDRQDAMLNELMSLESYMGADGPGG